MRPITFVDKVSSTKPNPRLGMLPTVVAAVLLPAALGLSAASAPAATSAGTASADTSAPRSILATANIFGAGYSDAPGEAGGGAGTMPPGWRLPAGTGRVVAFPSVTGTVNPIAGVTPYNGPEGDGARGTGAMDVESWRGISGLLDAKNCMFLVGVFIGDGEPALPAPPRLDFTDRERFDTLAPLVGQTFFIGDGKGRRYLVPDGATRLYVGFAEAFFCAGKPGYYGNNAGRLEVVASGVLDGPDVRLDTTAPELFEARNTTVTAPRGKTRARVRFNPYALDAVDGDVPVTCTPASGSFFKVGRTKVTCSATDTSGNTGQSQFVVRVRPRR
jgi:HYR domain